MTHLKIQEYKGQILGLATTIGIIGTVLSPTAQIKILIGSLFGGITFGSTIAYGISQSSTNYQFKKYLESNELKLTSDNQALAEVTKNLKTSDSERVRLTSELSQSKTEFKVLTALNSSNVDKINQLGKLLAEKEQREQALIARCTEVERLENIMVELKKLLTNKLTEYLESAYKYLFGQVATKLQREDYQNIHTQLTALKYHLESKREIHLDLLVTLQSVTDVNELLRIIWQIADEVTGLKVRYNNTVLTDEKRALSEYINNEGKLVSKDKASQALTMLKQKLDANYAGTISKIHANNENLDNLWGNVNDLLGQIDVKNLEIDNLQHQIMELRKPQRWTLASSNRILDIGNKFIEFFYTNTGIILDRAFSESDEYTAKLYFQIDRNSRGILPKELSEHSEALQQFCRLLHPVEFSYDANKALIAAHITLKLKEKVKATKDEINKLWRTVDKFESTVKGWTRLRITGGSESGKSPTAENIACTILKHRTGTAKLYNPQHDSQKNYWTIPVVGTSHKDSEKGIAALAKQVDARSNGLESREVFELSIFDEIDSTMSHTHGKKSAIGGDVNFIIKQASHQNLGAIFIGQNANVSEYPGMDRSDWNSAVNLHIGSNAYDALTNTNLLTTSESEKLKVVADKLTEFCESKNEELGIDSKTDINAYRFALVMEPGKRPYFIELPSYGTYTYDSIQINSGLLRIQQDGSVQPANTANAASEASNIDSTVTSQMAASGYVGVSCPKCNIGTLGKPKSSRGVNYYPCNQCGKQTSENILKKNQE